LTESPEAPPSPKAGFDRRALILLVLAAVMVAGIAVAVAVLGGGDDAPATGSAQLVPANALLYVHLSTDGSRSAVRQALIVARRLPSYPGVAAGVESRLDALVGDSAPGGWAAIRPWLGREAAFAALNTSSTTAGSLIVLDVSNRRLARRFLSGAGAVPDGRYGGVPLLSYSSGTVLAFVQHYLVLGQAASVRTAIDTARGRLRSLAAAPAYQQAAGAEPADRVLDVYLSAAGVQRVLAPRPGVLGALGTVLYRRDLTGAAVSFSAVPAGVAIQVTEASNPALTPVNTPPAPPFTPTLAGVLPSGTQLLLNVGNLSEAAPGVLRALAAAGVAGRVGDLLSRLGGALKAQGVDVGQLEAIFSGEGAVAVTAPGGGSASPALVILARTARPGSARVALANLEAPLAQLFPPPSSGPGQAPEWADIQAGRITVHQLAAAPGFHLNYSVFGHLVAFSTSLPAIAQIAQRRRALDQDAIYRQALVNLPDQISSLLFLDFSHVLSLGQQTGLVGGGSFHELRPDLAKVRAVGLHSMATEDETTAELLLEIP
jgi:hypothetical protein